MFQEFFPALSAVVQSLSSGSFCGMDLNAMNSAFNTGLNAQMQNQYNNIIQTNMNNPEIQRQYQVYLQQGGTLNFRGYCERYAETGGFTQQGYQNAMATQAHIHAQDSANMTAYLQHSQQLQQSTWEHRNAVQDRWAKERGENLAAQAPYINPQDGSTWQLPTNATPGQVFYDNASGNHFVMDIHGQYWVNNGQGWWQSMNYQR
ncbi:MAG: hypothetical protein JNL58_24475 [Planctomyces sp.]|nr:hypothetical protein [Planctomyces sp.]